MRTTGRASVEFTTFLTLVMSLPARRCALASLTDRRRDSPRRSAGEMSTGGCANVSDYPEFRVVPGPWRRLWTRAGEGPSRYELLGPSVDRLDDHRSIAVCSGPGCSHRARRSGLPHRLDLLLPAIPLSPKGLRKRFLRPASARHKGLWALFPVVFRRPGVSCTEPPPSSTGSRAQPTDPGARLWT